MLMENNAITANTISFFIFQSFCFGFEAKLSFFFRYSKKTDCYLTQIMLISPYFD